MLVQHVLFTRRDAAVSTLGLRIFADGVGAGLVAGRPILEGSRETRTTVAV